VVVAGVLLQGGGALTFTRILTKHALKEADTRIVGTPLPGERLLCNFGFVRLVFRIRHERLDGHPFISE
jgi:hypothetical protein